jgi:endonuclease YncB( thermonuclease family)
MACSTLACASPVGSPTGSSETAAPSPRGGTESVLVASVTDGDTIVVERGSERLPLRYVGIDAPERDECYGSDATEANLGLVEGGPVILERDVSETDRFGRLLRYVWYQAVGGQWVFVNLELVRGGFAEAGDYPPDERWDRRLEAAETVARQEGVGMWGACPLH